MAGGALGFGGGFATGFMQALMEKRQRRREREQYEQQRRDREFQMLFPVMFKEAQETGDFTGLENWMEQYEPGFAKKAQKEGGSPFSKLGPILTGRGQLEAPKDPYQGMTPPYFPEDRASVSTKTGTPPIAGPGPQTSLPASTKPETDPFKTDPFFNPALPAPAPAKPARPRFMGMEVRTNEERRRQSLDDVIAEETARAKARVTGQGEGNLALAQRLVSLGAAKTLEEALAKLGVAERLTGAGGVRYGGTLKGAQLPDGTVDAFGQPVDKASHYRVQIQPGGEMSYTPTVSPRGRDLGDYVENAAIELGFPDAEAAGRAGKMAEVNKRANELRAQSGSSSTGGRMEAAARGPLSTAQRFQALTDLQTAWRKAEAPQREMQRQLVLMETGLKRFNEGDRIGGSQAVLVTFQKILDPTSVVRESEYARTPEGLGLIQRIEGMVERLQAGGAGVPAEELAAMVTTAQEFLKGMEGWNDLERERITGTAKDFGLNPERVFGVAAAADRQQAKPAPSAGPKGMTVGPDGQVYVDGKPLPKK